MSFCKSRNFLFYLTLGVDSATEKLKETAQRWGNVAQQKVEHATQAGKEKLNDKYPSGGIQEMQQKVTQVFLRV